MISYQTANKQLPERVVLSKAGKGGLSWRIKLLPFIDQKSLYDEFNLEEPWDSDHNKKLVERMPSLFASPNDAELIAQGKTRYVALVGKGFLFDGKKGPNAREITDGVGNTIMIVEVCRDRAVIWTKPDDLEVDMNDVLAGLKGSRAGGFHAVLADGAVRFISESIHVDKLKALFTKAGGETIDDF